MCERCYFRMPRIKHENCAHAAYVLRAQVKRTATAPIATGSHAMRFYYSTACLAATGLTDSTHTCRLPYCPSPPGGYQRNMDLVYGHNFLRTY